MAKKQTPKVALPTAIYARYSSAIQNDASIEQQYAECEAYAAAHNLVIVARFEDRAISGKKDNRPGLQRMLRAADRGEFQVLLAYKSNRIARNMVNALRYEERLEQAGVRVVYCKEEFGDNATGRFMLRSMMNLNQFFSENLAEDVKRGLRDSAQKGKVVASVPFGYKKGEDGKFALDEIEAPIVKEIFRRVENNERYADIARDLNDRSIPTKKGGKWNKNSFHRILVNERYIGTYIYDDVRIECGMPAIIDRGLFEMVQQKVHRGVEVRARHTDNADYLLTGKLFCGHCLSAMIGMSANGHGGKYFYYMCQGKAVRKKCNKKNVRKNLIEEKVTEAVQTTVLDDEMIEWIVVRMVDASKRRHSESKLAEYEKQLHETNKELNNIIRAIKSGIPLTDSLKESLVDLEENKKNLEGLIAIERVTTTILNEDEVRQYMLSLREGDYRDPVVQRKVINTFVYTVYLYDDTEPDKLHFKININYTGEPRTYECLFSIGESTGNNAELSSERVRIEYTKVCHRHLIRTSPHECYLEVTEAGFVLDWYTDIKK